MAYIFPEHSEESQESPEQEIPVEEPFTQEEATPVIIESTPPSPSPEESLPPEARGETNGGPLGCCLGTILGLFLAFALVTGLSILMASGGTFITIPATILGACLGGFVGWRIGKRVYKEYTPPVVKQRSYAYSARTTRTKTKRKVQAPK